jgi:light-regulated signal transduction histidine kinase (bacteriophytochrome)
VTRLLDDLVDFGRLGFVPVRGVRFDTGEILDRVTETFADPIRESHAEIIRGALPQIFGSPLRFQRLLLDLVGNALKYFADGVVPRVRVTSTRQGEFWLFSVSDNGIGVEPRHHERIFEPFKRLHPQSRYEAADWASRSAARSSKASTASSRYDQRELGAGEESDKVQTGIIEESSHI